MDGELKTINELQLKTKKNDIDLNVSKKLIVIFILIIGILSFFAYIGQNPIESFNLFQLLDLSHRGVAGGLTVPAEPYRDHYQGMVKIDVEHRDSLDFTQSRTEGTDLFTQYYKKVDDENFLLLGIGDMSDVHIYNDDYLYFTVKPHEGKNLYISPSRMSDQALNPRVLTFDYRDINQDNLREWVFVLDMTNLQNPFAGQTAPQITLYTLSYDEGKMILNSPADMEVTRESSIDEINWGLEIPTKKAVAVNRVELIFDTTDQTKIGEKDSWIKIPYVDNLEFRELEKFVTSNEIVYRFELGNNLGGADYIVSELNRTDKHAMTVRLHTFLLEGEQLGVTLKITSISSDERFTTISDKVFLTAG